jgi:carbamoyltransferase
MNILGISAGFHDAAATVINRHGDILFAGHSERYSKLKNDPNISQGLIDEISKFNIDEIAYYETPWKKQLRRLYSGEGIQWNSLTVGACVKNQLGNSQFNETHPIVSARLSGHNHHKSHAAAGFQTSPFDRATVVVIDAVGEWDSISIWAAEYDSSGQANYNRLWTQRYPHSIGLMYSAATSEVGLRPMDEEYILMGMAAYGSKRYSNNLSTDLLNDIYDIKYKNNLHMGLGGALSGDTQMSEEDFAASIQDVTETLIRAVMLRAKSYDWSSNLVYMGGVALNCLANRFVGDYFDKIWIMPNPGDAGSSLGAAALAYGRRLNWIDAYLGHNIPGDYPVNQLVDYLASNSIAGVASGRAEFGPRALGNRSLLADPRGHDIKDRVNEIKRRQKFRPFAPVILAEYANDYFYMPRNWTSSPYMQSVARCRSTRYPAIVHHDGTSRVQTVSKDCRSGIRQLLEAWYAKTGCPMLLNTSLNIRGEPMVNNRADADRFEREYGVKVFS